MSYPSTLESIDKYKAHQAHEYIPAHTYVTVFRADIELCRSFFSCVLAIILVGLNLFLELSLIGSIFHFYLHSISETNEIPLNNNVTNLISGTEFRRKLYGLIHTSMKATGKAQSYFSLQGY